jgi:signal transduction histidine kinase
VDENGRLIAPNACLLGLQMTANRSSPAYRSHLDRLVRQLNDYGNGAFSSSQRCFLMEDLLATAPDCGPFATLAAEQLANRYAVAMATPSAPGQLAPTPLPHVWQFANADKTIVAVFRHERVAAEMAALIAQESGSADAAITLLAPGSDPAASSSFLNLPAGGHLPGWQVALQLVGPDPFGTAAQQRITRYLWTGVLVAVFTVVLASVVGRFVGRQVKFTRLKNDLIATVSHELKTPLASIRALVDTLLDNNAADPKQTREYLELVAKENARLSRLIDNFLAFSRMERNKHAFQFAAVQPGDVASTAADTVRERFDAAGCRFDVEVASQLPTITADRDALVTVVLNLLDNAYKYTDNDKQISLHVTVGNGDVCFEVQDNGIGLSRRAAKRIFDRFYQVDQRLSRKGGGCGLGLAIVRFIVDAHGGTIDVRSQLGKGSTFTVRLPQDASKVRKGS